MNDEFSIENKKLLLNVINDARTLLDKFDEIFIVRED